MPTQQSSDDGTSWVEEAADTSPKDLADEMREQLDNLEAKANDLRTEVEAQGEEAKEAVGDGLDEVEQAIGEARDRISNLADATGDEAEQLKDASAAKLDQAHTKFQEVRDRVGQKIES